MYQLPNLDPFRPLDLLMEHASRITCGKENDERRLT
jgi:hypothetical protein